MEKHNTKQTIPLLRCIRYENLTLPIYIQGIYNRPKRHASTRPRLNPPSFLHIHKRRKRSTSIESILIQRKLSLVIRILTRVHHIVNMSLRMCGVRGYSLLHSDLRARPQNILPALQLPLGVLVESAAEPLNADELNRGDHVLSKDCHDVGCGDGG